MFWTWVRSVFGAIASSSQISRRRPPGAQQAQDLELARGQRLELRIPSAPSSCAIRTRSAILAMTAGGSSVSPAWADRTAAHDLVGRGGLRQEAIGAGLDRVEHGLVVVVRGQHDHRGLRPASLDRPGHLGAGPVRQGVVHEHDVDRLAQAGPRLGRRVGGADDRDPRLGREEPAERLGQRPVVVDEQDPDRLRRLDVGRPAVGSGLDGRRARSAGGRSTTVMAVDSSAGRVKLTSRLSASRAAPIRTCDDRPRADRDRRLRAHRRVDRSRARPSRGGADARRADRAGRLEPEPGAGRAGARRRGPPARTGDARARRSAAPSSSSSPRHRWRASTCSTSSPGRSPTRSRTGPR